jgi:predicted 3-demethylubiquinone-9 3-methyltransferase (glyoxalase superfamily)
MDDLTFNGRCLKLETQLKKGTGSQSKLCRMKITHSKNIKLKKMNYHKIIPSLWFSTDDGKISKVVEYYKNIFGNDFDEGDIMPLGETPSGNAELCEVKIFGLKYSLMSTEKEHHSFNDALAFTINCENQKEIDKFWNYFTREGEESQCGWCIDKYKLRWQVLPENFGELMIKPNSWEVMMSQKKIVIEEYLK